MSKKKKTARIDSDNPALIFIDEKYEMYKYFDGTVCVANTNAYEGAKNTLQEIRDRVLQIKTTSKVKTDYVVRIIFEKLPNDSRDIYNFETYEQRFNVRNITTSFEQAKKQLGLLMKRIRSLEAAKDLCTKYRVTIICYKEYLKGSII